MDIKTFKQLGLDQAWDDLHVQSHKVNGRSNAEILEVLDTAGDAHYHPCAEAYARDGVPSGEVLSFKNWDQSSVFANTRRDIWVYKSSGADVAECLNLMVFNDGAGYLGRNGSVRATTVLDNLFNAGELAPTLGIFINPGLPPNAERPTRLAQRQHSLEYDSCHDLYLRFLVDEIVPFVARELNVLVSDNPADRTICGISSGGACAFNAAWHGPEHGHGMNKAWT